ncbi:MAG: hypothetical protein LBE60_10990 [Microbacterium sp.]|jgi:hypothetical protein|uniref:hypothetical protein n=1 Tax=Microbacterium sp. TaxID=51671 RepID=UPI00281A17FB|nr:hypothetical protein [Microbacterium sp.]MDR2322158.1 hypothetical protein [Microbacterium sp.]
MSNVEARTTFRTAVVLWVVELAVATAATFYSMWRRIEVPHCDTSCHWSQLEEAINNTGSATAIVVTVSTLLLFTVYMIWKPRWVYWIPIAGIVGVVTVTIIGNLAIDRALLFT